MKRLLIIAGWIIGFFLFASFIENEINNTEDMVQNSEQELVKISLVVGSKTFVATLYDNPTARSFMEQLPLKVEVEDYADIEKIFYPPEKLSRQGAPEGASPSKGDIMYYAPWGDVAIFYKDFRYASGLIPLGKLEAIDDLKEAVGSKAEVVIEIEE